MSAAEVVDGRCVHCGGRPVTWSAQEIVDAIVDWNERYGSPPRAIQWRHASPVNPSEPTVRRIFGSWNKAVRAAGLQPLKPHRPPCSWTKKAIENAMLDWLLAHGRWPTGNDWKAADGGRRPCTSTVYRVFGSWTAAKKSAGWTGVTPELVAA